MGLTKSDLQVFLLLFLPIYKCHNMKFSQLQHLPDTKGSNLFTNSSFINSDSLLSSTQTAFIFNISSLYFHLLTTFPNFLSSSFILLFSVFKPSVKIYSLKHGRKNRATDSVFNFNPLLYNALFVAYAVATSKVQNFSKWKMVYNTRSFFQN